MAESERERFEAWAGEARYDLKTWKPGFYCYGDTRSAWDAWQVRAALAARSTAADRKPYIDDLHDTLRQIADALGVEHGDPEALIEAAKRSTAAPREAQGADELRHGYQQLRQTVSLVKDRLYVRTETDKSIVAVLDWALAQFPALESKPIDPRLVAPLLGEPEPAAPAPAAAKCPDGLTPDGPVCPRCGGHRGPSGVDGGSWVHCPAPAAAADEATASPESLPADKSIRTVWNASKRALKTWSPPDYGHPAPTKAADEVREAEWRCFHCGEVFVDEESAAEHFGPRMSCDPACHIDIAKYREMEAMHARSCEEDTDLHRQIHRMECEHGQALRREEEAGYAKGLADGRASTDALVAALREACKPLRLPDAPPQLNTNDKAFWLIGYNAAMERALEALRAAGSEPTGATNVHD